MGRSEIEIVLEAPTTVGALKSMIKLPNGETLNAVSRTQSIMAAVDQEMVDDSSDGFRRLRSGLFSAGDRGLRCIDLF